MAADEKANESADDKDEDADGDNVGDEVDDKDDLHSLEMPKIDSDNTDSNDEDQESTATRIEDNNLLGDNYFDVKSDHCLMPLLPQHNAYNRNMVLSMGHSGVKFIIEKISRSLESEYQVSEVREKIMDRTINGEKKEIKIDEGLIADAHKMGREGLLTNMVLFDMNKQEAKELASRNLLEYRSDMAKAA